MAEPTTTHYEDVQALLSRGRRRTMALLWITYAGFYLCRVNLAAAQRSLGADLKLSEGRLGGLIAALKVLYAGGQLVNGVLADRLGPRALIATGLAGSAVLNLVFSRLRNYRAMLLTWALNGYFQSAGWTPTVRTIANWYPARLREGASGWIGTSYILGSGVSWLLAGRLTDALGWRAAFWVPALICLILAAVQFLALRDDPRKLGLPGAEDDEEPLADAAAPAAPRCPAPGSGRLLSARLLMLGAANMVFAFGYHGVLDWTPHYLAQAGNLSAGEAATKAAIMPVGGVLGCLALAFVARRRKQGLGPAAVMVPLLLVAGLTALFPGLVRHAPGAVTAALVAIGGLTSGPATLVACAMAADCGGTASAGAAAGIVDAMAYAGSATSGLVSGKLIAAIDGSGDGWHLVWRIWAAGMALGGIMVSCSTRAGRQGLRKTMKRGDRPCPDE